MTHYGHYARILHSLTDQAMTNALAQMELTGAQGHLIGYLCFCKEPPCPRDIEEAFQLSHPTVSGLLSRLEKKGFIELRPDKTDRRCKRVFILEKGRQVHSAMDKTIHGIEQQLVAGFSPEERTQFEDFLTRAIGNLDANRKFKEEPKEL